MTAAPRNVAIPRALRLLQAVDRSAGGWLVQRVKPRARQRPVQPGTAPPLASSDVRRVLVIRPGGLGDALLMWPMLAVLRESFPGARIDVLGERRNAGAFTLAAPIADFIAYDRNPLRAIRQLSAARYDLVIDTEQYHHLSTLVANALRPRWLCGFDTLGRRRLQTHAVAHSEDQYEVLTFLQLAATVSGREPVFDADHAFIAVPEEARRWAAATLRVAAGRPVVAISPVAGSAYRLWPAERYAAVGRWLVGRGFHVVVIGGSDGEAAAARIAEGADPALLSNFVGKTTLAQTAGLLSQARLSLSADTSVLHLAYGVGTPTVALFGPALYRKWAPPGRAHRLVRRGLACSPCMRFGVLPPCPYGVACMQEITVDEVIAAMEELLPQPG